MLNDITLEGGRARLVPLKLEHAPDLLGAAQSPDIWRYMPLHITDLTGAQRWIERALAAHAAGTELPFAIYDQHREQFVGSTSLFDINLANRNAEVGWTWLSPEVWRTRMNTECKYLLLGYAFEQLKLVRVQLKTDGRNERSQAAIARLGATREGVLRRHVILPDGFIRDSVIYSILDSDWPGVKARLESALEQ